MGIDGITFMQEADQESGLWLGALKRGPGVFTAA